MFGWNQDTSNINYLIKKEKYDEALNLLRVEVERHPENAFLKNQLANTLAKTGDLKSAIDLLNHMAESFTQKGQLSKALSLYKQIERIYPNQLGIDQKMKDLKSAKRLETPKIDSEPMELPPQEEHPQSQEPVDTGGGIAISSMDAPLEFEISGGVSLSEESVGASPDPIYASPLFQHLPEMEFHALISGLERKTYEPGEILCAEGEAGHSLMVLVSGTLRVYVRREDGRQEQIRSLPEGSFFGEIGLLTQKPRTATITAMSFVEILELDRKTLTEISKKHPEIPTILKDAYFRRANSPEEKRAREGN